jgi:tRNA A58 N-methylase Trm61
MNRSETVILERLLGEGPRWANYYLANKKYPNVRANEINAMIDIVNPQPADNIVEIGTGSGVLTVPIATRIVQGSL